MPRSFIYRAVFAVFFFNSAIASAQCLNSQQPSCGVYANCFAKLCNCAGSPAEYFLRYGKKYCEVFLDLKTLSPQGKAWRDSTLRCLQEKIVPALPADGQAHTCDCKKTETFAFDSHVACYTQPSASICALPKEDWAVIMGASGGVKSLTDSKSRKQIVEVAKVCVPVVSTDLKNKLTKFIEEASK